MLGSVAPASCSLAQVATEIGTTSYGLISERTVSELCEWWGIGGMIAFFPKRAIDVWPCLRSLLLELDEYNTKQLTRAIARDHFAYFRHCLGSVVDYEDFMGSSSLRHVRIVFHKGYSGPFAERWPDCWRADETRRAKLALAAYLKETVKGHDDQIRFEVV